MSDIVLHIFAWQVDSAAFCHHDFGIQAFFGEVDLSRIRFVDLDHRCCACDLNGERRGIRDGDAGDDVMYEDRCFLAVDLGAIKN